MVASACGVARITNCRLMSRIRLIPRLDVKGSNLIKGIQLKDWRVIGDPHEHAVRYYEQGADELLFMDIVASLYGGNNLSHIIERAVKSVFVPSPSAAASAPSRTQSIYCAPALTRWRSNYGSDCQSETNIRDGGAFRFAVRGAFY